MKCTRKDEKEQWRSSMKDNNRVLVGAGKKPTSFIWVNGINIAHAYVAWLNKKDCHLTIELDDLHCINYDDPVIAIEHIDQDNVNFITDSEYLNEAAVNAFPVKCFVTSEKGQQL